MRMRRTGLCNRNGGFLLEALMATMILGTGLTAVIRSFSMALDAQRRAREFLTASVILENALTDLVLRRYWDTALIRSDELEEPFFGYRCEVLSPAAEGSGALREVAVRVTWPGRSQDRVLEAVTYMFESPPQGASS